MSVVDLELLRAALARRRLSEEQFARMVGYCPATVSAFLSGRRSAPEAFAIIAEIALRFRPGQLRPGYRTPPKVEENA
jgi:transcriptional regulator with XRE-family HTH domain